MPRLLSRPAQHPKPRWTRPPLCLPLTHFLERVQECMQQPDGPEPQRQEEGWVGTRQAWVGLGAWCPVKCGTLAIGAQAFLCRPGVCTVKWVRGP